MCGWRSFASLVFHQQSSGHTHFSCTLVAIRGMKKIIVILLIHLTGLIQSCIFFNPCGNDDFTTYYITIERARGLFYSFDENGIFPYLDDYNRNELGITVTADSTTERIEISQLIKPFINSAFACQDPTETIFTNYIDSLNIFTKYAFDDQYKKGDNINNIMDHLDILGQTTAIDINTLTFSTEHLKFSRTPKYDSMQFIITGRIQSKGRFTYETDLVVLPE